MKLVQRTQRSDVRRTAFGGTDLKAGIYFGKAIECKHIFPFCGNEKIAE